MKRARRAPGSQEQPALVHTSFRDGFYLSRRRRVVVASKWPVARGKPKSATTRDQNEQFKKLVAAQKAAMPVDRAGAVNLAYGTTDTWRDVLARAFTGTLIECDNCEQLAREAGLIP